MSVAERMLVTMTETQRLLAQNQADTNANHSKLLEKLAKAQKESNAPRTKAPEPNLSAVHGEKLRTELKEFEIYMNEIKESHRRQWIKYARQRSKSTARTEIDYWIIQEYKNEDGWQAELLKEDPDPEVWLEKWNEIIHRLTRAVSMSTDQGTTAAIQRMAECKLTDMQGDPRKTQLFLEQYVSNRAKYIEFDLIRRNDETSLRMEIENFKLKIQGSDLNAYLLRLPDGYPAVMDSVKQEQEPTTILGRCRQYVKAQFDKHPVKKEKDDKAEIRPPKKTEHQGGNANANKGGGHFLVQAITAAATKAKEGKDLTKKQKKNLEKVRDDVGAMLGFTGGKGGKGGQVDPRKGQASRNPDKGWGEREKRPALEGGQGGCPTCKGHHPECSSCPNIIANKDS